MARRVSIASCSPQFPAPEILLNEDVFHLKWSPLEGRKVKQHVANVKGRKKTRSRNASDIMLHPPSGEDTEIKKHSDLYNNKKKTKKQTRNNGDLYQQEKKQTGIDSPLCDKQSTENERKRLEMKTFSNEKEECSSSSPEYSDFEQSSEPEIEYICKKCSKGFANGSNLRRHMLVHNNQKNFSCGMCPKSFSLKQNLQTHMRVHMKEKPFSCDVCTKSFVDQNNLRRHKLKHNGNKAFTCDCGMAFYTKQHLQNHSLLHIDEKPFSCQYCSSKFSRKDHFERHIRVHKQSEAFSPTVACE